MNNGLFTSCDNCAEVLEGHYKNAIIRKPLISFRGTMCLTTYDTKSNQPQYYYALEKRDALSTLLHFCADTDCMKQYMYTRKKLKDEYNILDDS